MNRLPFDFGNFLDRLRRKLRRGDVEDTSALVDFSLTMLESMVGWVVS